MAGNNGFIATYDRRLSKGARGIPQNPLRDPERTAQMVAMCRMDEQEVWYGGWSAFHQGQLQPGEQGGVDMKILVCPSKLYRISDRKGLK